MIFVNFVSSNNQSISGITDIRNKLSCKKATGASRPLVQSTSTDAYPRVHSQAHNFCRKPNQHLTQIASVCIERSRMWWERSISSTEHVGSAKGADFCVNIEEMRYQLTETIYLYDFWFNFMGRVLWYG